MDQIDGLTQAYTQAPWRKQLQLIGLFSLVLVFLALVAGIYLNVSARTAKVGRDVQYMRKQIESLDREIEDMQSQIALILSDAEMEKRAIALGFEPIEMDQIQFLHVQGYVDRQPAVVAPYVQRNVVSAPLTPKEYFEPLMDWIKRQMRIISIQMPAESDEH